MDPAQGEHVKVAIDPADALSLSRRAVDRALLSLGERGVELPHEVECAAAI
jgi:hypothetical protein